MKVFIDSLNGNAPEFTIAGFLSITRVMLTYAHFSWFIFLLFRNIVEIYPNEMTNGTIKDYYECTR